MNRTLRPYRTALFVVLVIVAIIATALAWSGESVAAVVRRAF